MGGVETTCLQLVHAQTGEPAPEVWQNTTVLSSSRNLGWRGIVAERGISTEFAADDLTNVGHLVAINLGPENWRLESKGAHGFTSSVLPPGGLWINPAGARFTLRTVGPPTHWGAVEISLDYIRLVVGAAIDPPVGYGIVDESLAVATRTLLCESESAGSSAASLASHLGVAVVLCLARRLAVKEPPARAQVGIGLHRLKRVREKIESALASSITVEDLAETAGLSPAHFARAFKSQTNETPHAFVMRRRLERAREFMSAGGSIAHAALACGFSDQAHLSRLFKRHFGITPGAFVRTVRGLRRAGT